MSECKFCELYCGDCGHHRVDVKNHIDYEQSSRACTSRTGMCEFFKDIRSERQKLVDRLSHKWRSIPEDTCIVVAAKIFEDMSDEEFDLRLKKIQARKSGGVKDEKD